MALRVVQAALTWSSEPPVLPALIIERIMPEQASNHG
jgi:hypothetical protein